MDRRSRPPWLLVALGIGLGIVVPVLLCLGVPILIGFCRVFIFGS